MPILLLTALTLCLLLTGAVRPAAAADTLTDRIAALTKGFDGTVAIYAKNLDTGQDFALRPDAKVRTASTIKLPILCALEAMVAAGATAIDAEPRPGSRGTTVAFIHPKGSFGTLIELVQE